MKGEHGRGYSRHVRNTDHQPDKVPPAVAALLAVTSIPPPKKGISSRKGRHHGERRGQQETVMALLDGRLFDETSTTSRSPLGILLSPSGELDQDEAELGGMGRQASQSAEPLSLDSVPLLETDDSSSVDSFSDPSSPQSSSEGKRGNNHRKEKSLSSPPAESCSLDHPLLGGRNPLYDPDPDGHAPEYNLPATSPSNREKARLERPVRRQSSLKSNLTASLRVLRSAAKSFSNFTTTPAIQTEDFLTRSILSISPQFTDERRPLPSDDTPTPALRRYLNPLQPSRQQYLHTPYHHLHSIPSCNNRRRSIEVRNPPCTASIQLQTYRRQLQPLPQSNNNSSCITTRSLKQQEQPENPTIYNRPREPRENSDFLRVIVLEMNMRRRGKLSDTAPGRARFVLPPRKTSLSSSSPSSSSSSSSSPVSTTSSSAGSSFLQRDLTNTAAPERWIGITA